ncbi:MAG: cytochrome P450, partial [Bradyrhizobium sp.]
MSTAEIHYLPQARAPLIPPMPPRAPDSMGAFRRVLLMGENAIATWSQRAYEDEIVRGRFFGSSSYILNTPDTIKHVLVDNWENYVRTDGAIRVLRPVLGEGLLIAEGR